MIKLPNPFLEVNKTTEQLVQGMGRWVDGKYVKPVAPVAKPIRKPRKARK